MRVASLPWYDLAEVRPATDRLWERVRGHLQAIGFHDAPDHLDRSGRYEEAWRSPSFLFGQACGYDLALAYREHLAWVATPEYAVPGCGGGRYRSLVLVRAETPWEVVADLRGLRCVVNTPTSHSGMSALRALVAPHSRGGRFFSAVLWSGAHERSLERLRDGRADVAAVDCVIHDLLRRHRPRALEGLRVLCETPSVPAPPYVTHRSTPEPVRAMLREALAAAAADPDLADARAVLGLAGIHAIGEDAYDEIAAFERAAAALDYDTLG
jgi:ABC-type phosphate/phosphonate transport system substrate-binding protein